MNKTLKKECTVVILPTKNKSKIFYLTQKGKERSDLRFSEKEMPNILDSENQHLYILSDDEIKGGDYILNTYSNNIFIWQKDGTAKKPGNRYAYYGLDINYCKKIIATTNETLNPYIKDKFFDFDKVNGKNYHHLPRPSNEFLKKFCELGGIDKVLVEYETIQTTSKEDYEYCNGSSNLNYQTRPKIAPDNTISIYPVSKEVTPMEMLMSILDNPIVSDIINQSFKDWKDETKGSK